MKALNCLLVIISNEANSFSLHFPEIFKPQKNFFSTKVYTLNVKEK